MKRVLVVILVLVMVFSMAACGPSVEDLPKEVEITSDNWDDYLEIKEIQTWKYDASGNASSVGDFVTVIALKDKYSAKTISEETVLSFEYEANVKELMMHYDIDNLEVEFMDPPGQEAEAIPVTNTTAYEKLSTMELVAAETYKQVTAECQPVGIFLMNPLALKANVYDDVKITSAEGTLVFEEQDIGSGIIK